MSTKFSEDVIPLTDLKTNPGRVVKHVSDAHRPVLITSRGRGVAVVQSVADFEQTEEERAFMRAVVKGPGGSGGRTRSFPCSSQEAAGLEIDQCRGLLSASQSRRCAISRRSRPGMRGRACPIPVNVW